ncbi:MAG: nuclear transport factor 2 family protein [Polyangiaceae bacterium]
MHDVDTDSVPQAILALERRALERWSNGDPSGFLEISAPEVTYFDPFVPQRIDGLDALREYYEALRGKVHARSFQFVNPIVRHYESIAVLTFNFVCVLESGTELRWNCTEVYRQLTEGWRIVQTHWSYTKI